MTSPRKPWVQVALGVTAGSIATLGITAVTSGGFALSFDAIRTIARASHINTDLDWMLPVTIDGAMAVASVTAIVLKSLGRQPWYPWVVVIANVLISVGCNALHAYQGGGDNALPGGWAMAVSAIPAINLALSLHLAIELVMAVVRRHDPAGSAKAGFARFAPTVIHGGTQPAKPIPSQTLRKEIRASDAPAYAPPTVPPSQTSSQSHTHSATQPANPAPTQPAKVAANPVAKVAEKAPAKVVEKVVAKPATVSAKPAHPLADDPNEKVRALARAYAKNPAKTNAELAKLAKVSIGSANRYLPQVRAAAVDSANADADEVRALGPLNLTPFDPPKQPVTHGANGYHPNPTEENRPCASTSATPCS